MKKIIFTFCLLMAAMFLTAQDVPQAINFQAIARDANSEVMANTPIMIQLSILDGSPEGELIYREIRSLTTNAYGSFSFQIGRDPYMAVGEFADIDWGGGRKFLKIDYDPTAMLQFNLSLGTVEFVSVPYAFAAGSVSYIDASGANDGDVLAYNATTGRFEPVAISGAGGGIAVETDPTVPDWAKAETKPTYDYSEIENTPDLSGFLTTESQTLADAAALGNSVNAQLKNVTDPTDAQDAVTKSYVDNLIAQLQAAINNIGGGQTTVSAPTVTTNSASNVTTTGATLSGNVTSDGNATVTARGFVYGTSANNLSQTVQSGSGTGSYTASLTGLASGTTYYYKAYATNSEGTGYGEIMLFTTTASTGVTSLTILNEQYEVITNTTVNMGNEIYFKVKNNSSSEIANIKCYLRVSADENAEYGEDGYWEFCSTQCGINGGCPKFTLAAGAEQLVHLFFSQVNDTHDFMIYTYPTSGDPTAVFSIHIIEVSDPTGYTNGHGYVDLGLPSGTRWATCNVGASTPTAYGNYYAWGETTTKSSYTSDNYTYSSNPTTLPSSADAATSNWGSGWRMPTQTEMQELINNCTVTWTTQNGVNGRLFTGSNGNSIFLPAAGYRYDSELYVAGSYGNYWSSSLYSGSTDYAWGLDFGSGYCGMNYRNRYSGFTVRAVCQSQN